MICFGPDSSQISKTSARPGPGRAIPALQKSARARPAFCPARLTPLVYSIHTSISVQYCVYFTVLVQVQYLQHILVRCTRMYTVYRVQYDISELYKFTYMYILFTSSIYNVIRVRSLLFIRFNWRISIGGILVSRYFCFYRRCFVRTYFWRNPPRTTRLEPVNTVLYYTVYTVLYCTPSKILMWLSYTVLYKYYIISMRILKECADCANSSVRKFDVRNFDVRKFNVRKVESPIIKIY